MGSFIGLESRCGEKYPIYDTLSSVEYPIPKDARAAVEKLFDR